jgi:hypothetical protein
VQTFDPDEGTASDHLREVFGGKREGFDDGRNCSMPEITFRVVQSSMQRKAIVHGRLPLTVPSWTGLSIVRLHFGGDLPASTRDLPN